MAYYEPSYFILLEYESVLEESYNLIHDIDLFHSVIQHVMKEAKFTYIKRSSNWFLYFNEKQFQTSMIYNWGITALLNASIENELILKQSQYVFDTSISFLMFL